MIGISSLPFFILGMTMEIVGYRMIRSAQRDLKRLRYLKKMQNISNN
mgnify:CR=1 FL=1